MKFDEINLLQRLIEHEVDFVIVGGVCNILHGVSLLTEDLDVCSRFSIQNLRRIELALRDLNPKHRMHPQKPAFELTDELAKELKTLYLKTDEGIIDCMSHIAGIGEFDAVCKVCTPVKFPFGTCQMLSMDALILSKETMGREHDLVAVRQLKAIRERKQRGE